MNNKTTIADREKAYGWEIVYSRHDGKEDRCHYVGTRRTAEKKAMLRRLAKDIISATEFTEEEWCRVFGRGRM